MTKAGGNWREYHRGCASKTAAETAPPKLTSAEYRDEFTWYVRQTHRITEVTEKGANSFDQELLAVLGRPVSSAYATTIAPPLSPWSPTLTGSHFEASLTEKKADVETENKSSEGGQCEYIFCAIVCTDC